MIKKKNKKQVNIRSYNKYKSRECEICHAQFVPDDDELLCLICWNKIKGKKDGYCNN